MLIGSRKHTAGNRTRYWVNYCLWLPEGRSLNAAGCTVALVAPLADVTVDTVSVTADRVYFFVNGGSVNEIFTVQVQATDSLSEVVIDTIQFTVVAP
jgi:hypothetical protein